MDTATLTCQTREYPRTKRAYTGKRKSKKRGRSQNNYEERNMNKGDILSIGCKTFGQVDSREGPLDCRNRQLQVKILGITKI